MKEESSELKDKADPNGAKWLSQNKVENINHFEKIVITYFLTWVKKLWIMRQVDLFNTKTDDEKKTDFNSEFPKYDYTLTEIIDCGKEVRQDLGCVQEYRCWTDHSSNEGRSRDPSRQTMVRQSYSSSWKEKESLSDHYGH
jgi:hypothetical protein